jgi:hypothetical protein
VVSPLSRAIETALLVYTGAAARPPIVAVETAREAYGAHVCDKRRPRAQLQQRFGQHVDFSALPEEDQLWVAAPNPLPPCLLFADDESIVFLPSQGGLSRGRLWTRCEKERRAS